MNKKIFVNFYDFWSFSVANPLKYVLPAPSMFMLSWGSIFKLGAHNLIMDAAMSKLFFL